MNVWSCREVLASPFTPAIYADEKTQEVDIGLVSARSVTRVALAAITLFAVKYYYSIANYSLIDWALGGLMFLPLILTPLDLKTSKAACAEIVIKDYLENSNPKSSSLRYIIDNVTVLEELIKRMKEKGDLKLD